MWAGIRIEIQLPRILNNEKISICCYDNIRSPIFQH